MSKLNNESIEKFDADQISVEQLLKLLDRRSYSADAIITDITQDTYNQRVASFAATFAVKSPARESKNKIFDRFNTKDDFIKLAIMYLNKQNLGDDYRDCIILYIDAIDRQLQCLPDTLVNDQNIMFIIDLVMNFAFRAGLGLGDPSSIFASFKSRAEAVVQKFEIKGREGGKKSGEKSRRRAFVVWKQRAKDMAIKIRASAPTLSQKKLADKITHGWNGSGLPDVPEIVIYIRELERSGVLPKKVKS